MPRVIPAQVDKQQITTQAVNGEITINLNLTITINQDGTVKIATANQQVPSIPDSIYAIPEFEATEMLDNFGEDADR